MANSERLRQLKRVVESAPNLWLDNWNHCAIGHARLDPWFQKAGLNDYKDNYAELGRYFGISTAEAEEMFLPPDEPIGISDKELMLRRLREYLPYA